MSYSFSFPFIPCGQRRLVLESIYTHSLAKEVIQSQDDIALLFFFQVGIPPSCFSNIKLATAHQGGRFLLHTLMVIILIFFDFKQRAILPPTGLVHYFISNLKT